MKTLVRWRLLLGGALALTMLLGMATPALAAVTDMFYGIRDDGTIESYDPATGAATSLIDVVPPVPDGPNFASSGPNGLAYDEITHRLYYTEYPDQNNDNMANLYFTDLDDSPRTVTPVGMVPGEVACADIYNGAYYYISGGNMHGRTDDFYRVDFTADGMIDTVSPKIDVAANAHAWMFNGDIAIWNGVIYGWGACSFHGYEFFKLNVDGSGFAVLDNSLSEGALQLAFSSDGQLWGHSYGSGSTYEVNWDAAGNVTTTFVRTALPGYTDTASGSTSSEEDVTYDICGFKLLEETEEGIEGWTIYLEKQNASGGWDSVVSTMTGASGKYCFSDLPAGTYRITEEDRPGFYQVYPVDSHIVTVPGGETVVPESTILYGSRLGNATGNNTLYELNMDSNVATPLYTVAGGGGTGNSPNALGFDAANNRLYYMKVRETSPFDSDLYFWDRDTNTETLAGLAIPGQVVVGADFYEGAYYYINNLSADLHKVSLKPDGTVLSDTVLWADFNGASPAVYRFGDFAIKDGVLYASTNDTGGSTGEFFKLDITTGQYTLISTNLADALLLQVSFGSDGVLYGHSAGSGIFYTIDLATGAKTTAGWTSVNKFSDLASGVQTRYYNFVNAPVPGYSLSGSKWYDRDTDGTWDKPAEPGIGGWKIYLYELQVVGVVDGAEVFDWVEVATALTEDDGSYSFGELEPGTYKVAEGVDANPASCWRQTTSGWYTVTIADADVADVDFGNVCESTSTGGYTLGYWSNKVGQATLAAYNVDETNVDTWQDYLTEFDLVGKVGSDFDPTIASGFRTWLLKADATNMSYMLSVQMACTALNIEVKETSYAGMGVIDRDGNWISIADLLVKANAFLGSNPVTTENNELRAEAEFYKNIFDALNNNRQKLIPEAHCPVPMW